MVRVLAFVLACLAIAACSWFDRPRRAAVDYPYTFCPEYGQKCPTGASLGAVMAAAEAVSFFPWPPPEPSSMVDLTARFGVGGSLGDIARRIDDRLAARGYDQPLYYEVPGGFAVTTPLERFSETGRPAAEGRFNPGKLGGWHGSWDYITTFFQGEQGRFRVFVFVISDEPFNPARFKATQTDVERWGSNGELNLPRSIAGRIARKDTNITLLIYEFQSSQDRSGGVRQARDRTPSINHLRWLGF